MEKFRWQLMRPRMLVSSSFPFKTENFIEKMRKKNAEVIKFDYFPLQRKMKLFSWAHQCRRCKTCSSHYTCCLFILLDHFQLRSPFLLLIQLIQFGVWVLRTHKIINSRRAFTCSAYNFCQFFFLGFSSIRFVSFILLF